MRAVDGLPAPDPALELGNLGGPKEGDVRTWGGGQRAEQGVFGWGGRWREGELKADWWVDQDRSGTSLGELVQILNPTQPAVTLQQRSK